MGQQKYICRNSRAGREWNFEGAEGHCTETLPADTFVTLGCRGSCKGFYKGDSDDILFLHPTIDRRRFDHPWEVDGRGRIVKLTDDEYALLRTSEGRSQLAEKLACGRAYVGITRPEVPAVLFN